MHSWGWGVGWGQAVAGALGELAVWTQTAASPVLSQELAEGSALGGRRQVVSAQVALSLHEARGRSPVTSGPLPSAVSMAQPRCLQRGR